MGQIKVTKCPIDGLYVIEPTIHKDSRGDFYESYNSRDMEEAGLNRVFVQDNESFSVKGVLRGLHFQKRFPQCKLARVIEGAVFDVAVDLREDSPTYGKWYGVELSAENHKQFLIPEGFAMAYWFYPILPNLYISVQISGILEMKAELHGMTRKLGLNGLV